VTPDVLAKFRITTLTLEDLASCDGEELGAASNPYAVIGLIISKAVVKANANLNSSSRGVALKSIPETGQNQIDLRFAKPQGGFGFFIALPGPLRFRSRFLIATKPCWRNTCFLRERDMLE
jgi:hypothetical protein